MLLSLLCMCGLVFWSQGMFRSYQARKPLRALDKPDEHRNDSLDCMSVALAIVSKQQPCVPAGVGSSSTMVQALKNLPQQQQLLICAATKLLGGHKQEPGSSAANQPTSSALSGLPRKASSKAVDGNDLPILPCSVLCSLWVFCLATERTGC